MSDNEGRDIAFYNYSIPLPWKSPAFQAGVEDAKQMDFSPGAAQDTVILELL